MIMWTLVKGSFWFSLVLVTIPFFDAETRDTLAEAPPVAVGESVSAAFVALEDIRGLCARNPGVCETGGETVIALGIRAREGARLAYEFLDERFQGDKPVDNALTTASVPDVVASAGGEIVAVPVPVPAPARPLP